VPLPDERLTRPVTRSMVQSCSECFIAVPAAVSLPFWPLWQGWPSGSSYSIEFPVSILYGLKMHSCGARGLTERVQHFLMPLQLSLLLFTISPNANI